MIDNTLLTLKIEQALENCAIFMLLSRFVCSSESDESGIAIQRSGITPVSALTAPSKKPFDPK